ncbi:hypothetical protein NPIL_493541 [Nephila pilipes]|uniref:Uncharacterized protein n=1 Tax=Nephila pilipes TaxID=299642 RepID=A0A8X6TXE3_NEPPI|nr:hypothetical protein NPIL_493541 [Nephila pilipes]
MFSFVIIPPTPTISSPSKDAALLYSKTVVCLLISKIPSALAAAVALRAVNQIRCHGDKFERLNNHFRSPGENYAETKSGSMF